MWRSLKVIHLTLISMLAMYAGKQILRWGTKIANPESESVRFWRPGPELVIAAISFFLLVGILASSTGMIRNRSWTLLGSLHGLWIVCFTWFGWFSFGGPFTLKELGL